jgi:RNA polymerase sigma-70 factor (ECF subfamily)
MDRNRAVLDEALLERLYRELERPLYNVVYRRLWNQDEALDAIQETFVRLWRIRGRVNPATAKPLIYRMALNLAANKLRARRIRRWVTLDGLRHSTSGNPSPHDITAKRTEEARLRAAVEALPEDLRGVVLLSEFSEMSYDEIGRALSIPPGTVGSRRNRALKLLREKLVPSEEKP